jgi:hypothetical protein
MRAFENRVLKRGIWALDGLGNGSGEDYITSSFIICIPYQIFRWSNQEE